MHVIGGGSVSVARSRSPYDHRGDKMRILLHAMFLLGLSTASAQVDTVYTEPEPKEVELIAASTSVDAIGSVEEYLQARAAQVAKAERGEYGRISRRDTTRLRTANATIQLLLGGQESALDLRPWQKVELFNAQETIASILKQQSETAMVCEQVRRTGSKIPTTSCATRAEREARRAVDSDMIQQRNSSTGPECAPTDPTCGF